MIAANLIIRRSYSDHEQEDLNLKRQFNPHPAVIKLKKVRSTLKP